MATIAEFTVPSEAFPLGHLFDHIPDVTIELDRIAPTNEALIPFVWVRGGAPEDIISSVERHPGLRSMRLVDQADGIGLFRVEWEPGVKGVIACITETDALLVSGTGQHGEWYLRSAPRAPMGFPTFNTVAGTMA